MALVDTVTNSSPDEHGGKLKAFDGWYEDDNTGEDGADLDTNTSKARADDILASKVGDYFGRLQLGFLNQDCLLLPNVKLTFRLRRADASFALNAATATPDGGTMTTMEKCSLMARLVQANPAVQSMHNEALLEGHRALYPFARPKTNAFTISNETTSETVKIQDAGKCPELVYVFFVDQERTTTPLTKTLRRSKATTSPRWNFV